MNFTKLYDVIQDGSLTMGDPNSVDVSVEMISSQLFMQRFSVWNNTTLLHTVPIDHINELPGNSVIHCLDSLNDVMPSFVPKDNPFLLLGATKKYIKHITAPTISNPKIAIPDQGVYLPSVNLLRQINGFTSAHSKSLKYITPGAKDPILNTTTNMYISYNPLFRAVTRGILNIYRKFNFIFSVVLNTVLMYPDKTNFIYVPLPTDVTLLFKRSDFDRTFKKIDKGTLRYPDFPHYLLFVELLNFVHNTSELGMLNQIPTESWANINFIISNGSECVIYNLAKLKELNSGHVVDDTETDNGNELAGNRIIYRLIDQINNLCTSHVMDDHYVSPIHESIITTSYDPEELNIPIMREPIHKGSADVDKHISLTKEIEEHVKTTATTLIENDDELTQRQKARALQNLTAYEKLQLGAKPVSEIIHSIDNNIDSVHLDVLDYKLEDKSMMNSSVITFDNSYIQKTFEQDLMGVLTSFNKLGMFLTDVKKEDISDELNKAVQYTVKYTDVHSVPHPSIKFVIPRVDTDGKCYINGIWRMMKKQRTNNPMCKVSSTRITLNSSYNRAIVERVSNSGQFYIFFTKLLLPGNPEMLLGKVDSVTRKLPYEYAIISSKIIRFKLKDCVFFFDYDNRFDYVKKEDAINIIKKNEKYGVYCGYQEKTHISYFMNNRGQFIEVDTFSNKVVSSSTISNKVAHLNGTNSRLSEYVQLKILNINLPIGFVLCYKYGLTHMLRYLNVDYSIYNKYEKYSTNVDDTVLEFKDKTLVINRVPLVNSLIFNGLCIYNTKKYTLEQMNDPDTYFDMLSIKNVSINYLKGLDSFYDLFIGYIEHKLLKQMGEPTTIKELLVRCVFLLTTLDHIEASSSSNFRIRSYEKFCYIIYNELARAYATWSNKSIGHSDKFSVNPFIIQQRIYKDGLFDKLDVVNPIHQIKSKTNISHLGEGGRTADTFTLQDRRFTKDSIGILSESTVDNSSVGITAGLSMDPNIVNTNGVTQTRDIDTVKPTQLLSITSLLFPSLTQDDQFIRST